MTFSGNDENDGVTKATCLQGGEALKRWKVYAVKGYGNHVKVFAAYPVDDRNTLGIVLR